MKKLLMGLFLLTVLLLPACAEEPAPPSSGTHTHLAAEKYAHDERHHWTPCTVDGCNIKLNWAEHRFSSGVVTTLPTEESDGVMTYTCGCGYEKNESIAIDHADALIFGEAVQEERLSNVCVRLTAVVGDSTEQVTALTACFDGELLSLSGKLQGEDVRGTTDDAARIGAYRAALFFFKSLRAQDLRYDAAGRIYVSDSELTVELENGTGIAFEDIGLRIANNAVSYVSCRYTYFGDSGVTEGKLEMALYDYGNNKLQ